MAPPTSLRIPAFAALLCLALLTAAPAQTPINGNISDGSGGPLLSGTVYHVTSFLQVPGGQTLTIQPGAIVKFPTSAFFQVTGTLNVTASAGNPAILTSLQDDAAGGDTNGDGGATTPAPGDWNALLFGSNSDASVVSGLIVRYSGSSGNAGISLSSTDVTLTDSTVDQSANRGLDLNGNSFPTVSGCTFSNNGGVAVSEVRFDAVPGFSNNSASGNVGGDYMDVLTTVVSAPLTVNPNNILGTSLVLSGSVTISASGSLTLGAGVIFKFDGNGLIDFSGTLLANGTAGNEVVFTSFTDDDHGGDTNGDGPSSGSPGQWNTLIFRASASSSVLTNVIVRYNGSGANGAVDLVNSDITLTNCTIDNSASDALDCSGISAPTVSGCDFTNCQIAVQGLLFQDVPNFTNNTASGNVGDYMRINTSTVGTAVTVTTQNVLEDALVLTGSVTISSAGQLTLDDDVIMKFEGNGLLDCSGPLFVTATQSSPVILTTITDDASGGDTNKDGGATTPAPGAWNTVIFRASASSSVVQGLVVRYAGSGGNGCIDLVTSDVTLTDCVVENGGNVGLDVSGNSTPTVSGCSFDNNAGVAVSSVRLEDVPNFTANTAAGNAGDYMTITSTAINIPTTITTASIIGSALVTQAGFVVNQPLNIGPGVNFKLQGNAVLDIRAPLICSGVTGNRVVFTTFEDDTIGGDTNKDGPSVGTPGSWNTMIFRAAAIGSVLDVTTVRFGGSGGNGAIDLSASDITMTRCLVQDSANSGLDLSSNSTATVTQCDFQDNTRPISGVTWEALQGLRNNVASGHSLGDHILMTDTVINGPTSVERFNLPGDVLVVNSSFTIFSGTTMSIGPGVNMKFVSNALVDVQGTLNIAGTGFEPVVFTSFEDDDVVGDTNGDGMATTPAPGDWSRVIVRPNATGFMQNLRLRYGGSSTASLQFQSPMARLRNLRVDHSATEGVEVSAHSGAMENWVVDSAASHGIGFVGNNLQVINATIVGNGGAGIDRGSSTGSTIHNSIVWNNTGGDLASFAAGDVFNCDADPIFAGMNGNISTDPLFVDEAGGDFALTGSSPCIGAADSLLAAGLVTDHNDFSRLLDDDLDGLPFADMGAFERELYVTTFTGRPRMGTAMTFGADVTNGPPGFAILIVGLLDGSTFILPYGFISVGDVTTILPANQIALGESIIANLPFDPALEGFTFAVQSFVLVSGNPAVGQITNRYVGSLFQ